MEGVLVLGAGQVGTFAARALATEGVPVIAADLAPALGYFARFGPPAGRAAELVTVNIQDAEAIRALIKAHAVDALVLCAGPVGSACDLDPQKAWEINVDATRQVAETALYARMKRLVFISTLAVYGRPAVDSIAETVPVHPQFEYGRTKAAAENALLPFRDEGLDIRILRPCGVYGPLRIGLGSHSARFIESVLLHAVMRGEVTIQASHTTADEYLYVKDLGRAITLATLRDTNSPEFVFNVGLGRRTTAQELCLALRQVVPGVRVTIESMDEDQSRPMAPLNVSRIRDVFGFEPRYGLVEGLTDYFQIARFQL